MALVLAGLVATASLLWAFLLVAADGSRPIPTHNSGALPTLIIGLVLAAVIAWSHWWTIHW